MIMVVHIITKIGDHAIIIDRICDFPGVAACSIRIVHRFFQYAVADTFNVRGTGVSHAHTVWLIGLRIFTRKPDTCSKPLTGNRDPWQSVFVFSPDNTSIPGRINGFSRLSVIMNNEMIGLWQDCFPSKIQEMCISDCFQLR